VRALASLLAVAAVATVGAAAAVDALRGGPAAVPGYLHGELVYSDSACHRHTIRLPDLVRRDFLTVGCGVFTRRDNLGVRDGAVAWFAYPDPGGTTTLLRRRDVPAGVTVQTVAWLGGTRFAAVLAPGGDVTVWEGSRQLTESASGAFTELRASPGARYFAALGGERVAVMGRDGRRHWETAGRAIAWSPDERYAAVARAGELVIVPAAGGDPLVRLDVRARDVDWRMHTLHP
jgi:hypothetical protein